MAKVVNMAKAIQQKQEEKLAIELLKEIRKAREFFDFTGEKLDNDKLAWVVRQKLDWWAM